MKKFTNKNNFFRFAENYRNKYFGLFKKKDQFQYTWKIKLNSNTQTHTTNPNRTFDHGCFVHDQLLHLDFRNRLHVRGHACAQNEIVSLDLMSTCLFQGDIVLSGHVRH